METRESDKSVKRGTDILEYLVLTLTILGSLSCGPAPTRIPHFSATGLLPVARVSEKEATFWLPIGKTETVWPRDVWRGSVMEYSWVVRAKLLGNAYDFGYVHFADPKRGPEMSGFRELLENGDVGVWVLAPNQKAGTGLPEYRGVTVTGDKLGLTIKVTEPRFVDAFRREMPKNVLFIARGLQLSSELEEEEVPVQYMTSAGLAP